MNPDALPLTRFCVLVAITLGIVTAFGGFLALLIVVLFAVLGLLVGRFLDGKFDLAALFGRSTDH